MKKALLTTKEAAEYIGYGEQALRTSRMAGGSLGGQEPPKHIRVGSKTIRYKLADLDEWIERLG
ncbi:MAG: excisionase [Candidatus Pacearchaeota archaeon]|nr:excisionase [Candidatus Pacearchaeota archaeon]